MTIFNRSDRPSDPRSAANASGQPQRPAEQQPYAQKATAQPISPPAATTGAPMASVISKALKITGQLESTEDIQIDGEIDGDVRGVGVKIGSNAKVKGTVYGEEVELAGTIDGKIEAKKVVLTGTARMSGDVVHQDVRIESGAFIDGHLKPEFSKAAAKSASVASFKPVAAASPSPAVSTPEKAAEARH